MKRFWFVLDWFGFLLLVIISLPLILCIARAIARAMWLDAQ